MDIYTSIPYDEGWHVYVDGEEAETYDLGNALLAVKGSKGNHKVKFVYKIPHFMIGCIASLIALLIITIPLILKKYKQKKADN